MEAGSKICSEGAQSTSAAAQIADEEAQCQLLQRRIAEAKRCIAELVDNEAHRLNNAA